MGLLEAADLHLVKHWVEPPVVSTTAERSMDSQVFPTPERETLSSVLRCPSSVRRPGIVQEEEEQ